MKRFAPWLGAVLFAAAVGWAGNTGIGRGGLEGPSGGGGATSGAFGGCTITGGVATCNSFVATVGSGGLEVSATGRLTFGGGNYINLNGATGRATSSGGTELLAGTAFAVANNAIFNTAPTVSGFGTSPSVVASNGTAAFIINVGTGGAASTGTITLPAATTGWVCACFDVTTPASFVTSMTGGSTTTCTVTNYSRTTGLAIAWTASDILRCTAVGY